MFQGFPSVRGHSWWCWWNINAGDWTQRTGGCEEEKKREVGVKGIGLEGGELTTEHDVDMDS